MYRRFWKGSFEQEPLLGWSALPYGIRVSKAARAEAKSFQDAIFVQYSKSMRFMDGNSLNITRDLLEKLKELVPQAFSEEKVDLQKLQTLLGEAVNTDNERYQLTWAGKSEAYKVLQMPTTGTLIPQPEQSVNWDESENIFIEGENLEVLKVLQKSYYGKIKMIYIDPPYNTGSDSFIYMQ